MQAYMNINVRVLSAQAQSQIKAMQAQIRAMDAQLAKANATSSASDAFGSPRQRKGMAAWGNQIQWTGRQLQYNWTLPLALAGGMATKWALDNEKAFTRVRKVYGDSEAAIQYYVDKGLSRAAAETKVLDEETGVFANELNALEDAMAALSSRFGVQQKEVMETAGAWAAAGQSGKALAESTELSLRAAVLGDMDLAKATEALIAIQAQYSLSTADLSLTLAELNSIENQTGISMQGLIDGFSRSAGVAREAGVDVRNLGAMLAALVPATGSAATAGNALKTIISRIMSPTQDSVKVMKEFGVDTSTAMWQSSTAMERLMVLSRHMADDLETTGDATKDLADDGYKLSDSQKQVVASVLGSRYQMNRFLVLMRELGPEHSYFEKALDATADSTKVFQQANKELNDVLESNPKRLEIMWYTLQNGLANAIQPMIPYIIYLAGEVANLVKWFNDLDPVVQKIALVLLVLLAAVGPLVRYFGSLATLIGTLGVPLKAAIGWWVRFTTVTKLVDGALVTTRRSFIGMILSMVKAPFSRIAVLIGSLLAPIASVGKFFLAWGPAARAGSAVAAAAPTVIVGGVTAAGAAMRAVWAATWGAMVLIQSGALLLMLRNWMVNLALTQRYGVSMFARLGVLMASALAAASVLFSRQFFAPLLLAVGRGTMLIQAMWTSMWVGMRAIMVTGQLALQAAFLTFRLAFLSGWAGLYLAKVAIDTKGYNLLVRLTAAFQVGMAAVMTAGRSAILAIWAGMHAMMLLMTTAFWRAVAVVSMGGVGRFLAAARGMLAVRTILTNLRWAIVIFARALPAILMSPWFLAAAAIVAILYTFRSELVEIWNNIVAYFSDSSNEMTKLVIGAWNALPAGVSNALVAVAKIVQAAALQIYEWFSYINPFARHSPSLVENVTNGTSVISGQFGRMASDVGSSVLDAYDDVRTFGSGTVSTFDAVAAAIKSNVAGAYSDITKFGNAVQSIVGKAQSFKIADDRKDIKKYAPGALDEFDALIRRLASLNKDLATMEGRLNRQQAIVDAWTAKVKRANDALEVQQEKLNRLAAIQDKWQAKLESAQDKLDKFASAPIQGMQAMSDKIFDNEMAQKRLRLEMMKMEETTGPLDDIRAKIEAINAAQESLRGERAALRGAGAGSEILSQYDEQIAALEKQKKSNSAAAESLGEMSDALDELQRKGEMLDLENSLKFDPLTRQIEQAANAMEELPFATIMAGIKSSSADVEKYQQKYDAATAAMNAQQAVVDKMTKNRDALQERLDRESETLDKIKSQYDEVASAISGVEQALSDASGAAASLAAAEEARKGKKGPAVSPAVQNFRDAAGGEFAQVGGAGIPVRTNFEDESQAIKDLTKGWADEAAGAFGDINPFNALKKKWGQFQEWFKGASAKTGAAVGDMFGSVFGGVGGGIDFQKMEDNFRIAWAKTSDWFSDNVVDPIKSVWKLFGPSLKELAQNAWNGVKEIWKQIGPVLSDIGAEFVKMGPAVKGFWNVLKPVLALLGGTFVVGLKLLFNGLAKAVYPVLQMIGNVLENLFQVVKGAVQIISGFFMMFSGEKGAVEAGLKKMLSGVLNIFSGLFGAIGQLIYGAAKTVIMFFWGLVDGVIDAAKWLWDVLVGHSIIPDIVEGITFWFKKLISLAGWLWNNVAMPIARLFGKLFTLVVGALKLWWAGIQLAWTVLKTLGSWFWNNILAPIWSAVQFLWNNAVKPALDLWWTGITTAWSVLAGVASWLWTTVLKPIWDVISDLWTDYVRPGFEGWWSGIKAVWAGFATAGTWVWRNVLKPVWDKVSDLWTKVRTSLGSWWTRIQTLWSGFKSIGTWFGTNIIGPVAIKVDDAWEKIKTNVGRWWDGITRIWSTGKNAITGLGGWFYNNVMKPVYDKVTGVFTSIKTWLTNNASLFTDPMKAIVNVVIGAVNAIINGLNKVADVLPGVDWEITTIQKLARGGEVPTRRGNRGFKTSGARAIVGEGKANHPEFVIPTDPTYRNRARSLLAMANAKINGGARAQGTGVMNAQQRDAHGVPMFGIGGWLGDRWDDAKGIADEIGKLPRKAVGKIMDPVLDKGRDIVKDKTGGWVPIQSPPLFAINKLEQWVKDSDKSVRGGIKKYATPAGGDVTVPAPNNPGGRSTWRGGTFSNKFIAHMQKAEKLAGAGIHVMQGGFRPATSYSGTSHKGDALDMQVNLNLLKALRRVGVAAGDRTGLGNWAPHIHAVPGPGAGYAAGSATWQWQDYMAKGGMNQPTNSAWGLKSGGIALAQRGPTAALLGDGRHDEAVVPLPKGWRSGLIGSTGGDTVINVNGDLSFPNIKDGDDAETFIENIKNLAKD